jgi:hypothetical protein
MSSGIALKSLRAACTNRARVRVGQATRVDPDFQDSGSSPLEKSWHSTCTIDVPNLALIIRSFTTFTLLPLTYCAVILSQLFQNRSIAPWPGGHAGV